VTFVGMAVYRLRLDTQSYRTVTALDLAGASLVFEGQSIDDPPAPIRCRFQHLQRPRADFMYFKPGTLVASAELIDKYFAIWEGCEFVALDINGQAYCAVNVVHVVNALDPERSCPASQPLRTAEISAYVFRPKRLRSPEIFKLPETAASEILVASRPDSEDDLIAVCRRDGLTGLKFQRLWVDDSAAT
jgi:hypothetical protein